MFDPQTIQAANEAYSSAYKSQTDSPPHDADEEGDACSCYVCECWHHGYLDAEQKVQA